MSRKDWIMKIFHPLAAFCLLAFAAILPGAAPAPADENPNGLSLQIPALRTLYTLNLSTDQLQQFKTPAAGAADPSARKAATVPPKLLDATKSARSALAGSADD